MTGRRDKLFSYRGLRQAKLKLLEFENYKTNYRYLVIWNNSIQYYLYT